MTLNRTLRILIYNWLTTNTTR